MVKINEHEVIKHLPATAQNKHFIYRNTLADKQQNPPSTFQASSI